MIDQLREKLCQYDMKQSQTSLEFAIEKHRGQVRSEGTPYILHPVQMALHALYLGIREDELISVILLHDVCEDCDVCPEELPVTDRVREGVRYITKTRLPRETKAEALARYFQQMRCNREACVAKLFDRCHNLSSMGKGFDDARMIKYRKETLDYVYPVLEHVRTHYPEFEDICGALEYQMNSVLIMMEHFIPLSS